MQVKVCWCGSQLTTFLVQEFEDSIPHSQVCWTCSSIVPGLQMHHAWDSMGWRELESSWCR
jgi:hypothetical protein